MNKWDQIPDDTDILISHTPPVGYGDLCCTGVRAGCVELLNTVRLRVRPKVPIHKLRKQKLGILFFLVLSLVLHYPKNTLETKSNSEFSRNLVKTVSFCYLNPFILKRQLQESRFFQHCGTFCFDLY